MAPTSLLLVLRRDMHALYCLFMAVSSNHYKNMDRDGNRSNKHEEIMKLPILQSSLGIYFLLSQQHSTLPPPRLLPQLHPNSFLAGSRSLLRVMLKVPQPHSPGAVFSFEE